MKQYLILLRWVVIASTIILAIAACDSADSFNHLKMETITFNLPHADYYGVAWLTESRIAFAIDDGTFESPSSNVFIYDMVQQTQQPIATPANYRDCNPRSRYGNLTRLPDGRLGLTYWCLTHGFSGGIFAVSNDGEPVSLQTYPVPSFMTSFAYSPDMQQLVQEDSAGAGFSNTLYFVHDGGDREAMLPNFARTSSPDWSPDGRWIAFSGTQGVRIANPNTMPEMIATLDEPWHIYLYDVETQETRLLVETKGRIGAPKWSPDGRYLAYTGDLSPYRGGIWIIDMETAAQTQVWGQATAFDWSPDGTRMIILQIEQEQTLDVDSRRISHPIVISVPIGNNE